MARSRNADSIGSFGFTGQSITAACSVMVVGPALSALAIFHSSECADVVNVPGGNGAVADERSSAVGIWTGPPNDGQHLLSKSLLKHRDTLHSAAE